MCSSDLHFFAISLCSAFGTQRFFVIMLFIAYPHTKLPHTKLVLFDSRFATVYVYPFSAQNLRFVIVDVVSNFLSNTKEKSQQNQPLAFELSNNLLTKNTNKINKLCYLNYSHSIVPGGFEVMS